MEWSREKIKIIFKMHILGSRPIESDSPEKILGIIFFEKDLGDSE